MTAGHRRRVSALMLLAGLGVVACAASRPMETPRAVAAGDAEFFLEPNDAQGVCSATIGLRNVSGLPRGEALLRLEWLDARGKVIQSGAVRMDPTKAGQYTAKNAVIPGKCSAVAGVKVRSAQWRLGWDSAVDPIGVIAGVDGAQWRLEWDPALGLFVGRRGR